MKTEQADSTFRVSRRDFMSAVAAGAAGIALRPGNLSAAPSGGKNLPSRKEPPLVRGAFLYPPTKLLEEEGYYSWPGSGFGAEAHQKQYMGEIARMAERLGIRVQMDDGPLFGQENVARFIAEVKDRKPDGLLLVAFKKSEWESVRKIAEESALPTVAMATLGVLLNPQLNQLYEKPGIYAIASLDNFDAIEYGLKMIATSSRMRKSRILSVVKAERGQSAVPHLGTEVVVVPTPEFAEMYRGIPQTDEVRLLAEAYLHNALKCVEPSEADVYEAARLYFACKRILAEHEADAIMIKCLDGIREKDFPPPCMAFMSLRDEGIVAGCQNDLDATLTMMLVQELFGLPGFQQNSSCDTEKNHHFGAHCTCPTKLAGFEAPPAAYILRNHAEAGVGAVPQVLWPAGEKVTMAHYLANEEPPQMLVYSGQAIGCHDTPPAGGCRTNVEITINELEDVTKVKGMHQTIFLGDRTKELHRFCQMFGIVATI